MQTFREWLREKELNKSPSNLGDMDGLQYKEDFKNKVIENFSKLDNKEKKKAKNYLKSLNIL